MSAATHRTSPRTHDRLGRRVTDGRRLTPPSSVIDEMIEVIGRFPARDEGLQMMRRLEREARDALQRFFLAGQPRVGEPAARVLRAWPAEGEPDLVLQAEARAIYNAWFEARYESVIGAPFVRGPSARLLRKIGRG